MCICLITMIVHVVTERFIANSFQPFIYYVLSDNCCLQNPFTDLFRSWLVSSLSLSDKLCTFFMSVSILFGGLFMSGIPRTSMIKIASNEISIAYLVMQIRYSFLFQCLYSSKFCNTHDLSMCLKIMLILTNGNLN